jgi:hypothetical protein
MFCVVVPVFSGTEGVGFYFHVPRPRTHFRGDRRCRLPFSCFARRNSFSVVLTTSGHIFLFSLQDTFSAVARSLSPIYLFCAPELIFGGIEGIGSRLHVLRARTSFVRNLRRRVLFSCFALPDTFSAVRWVSGPVFMFCAPGLVFGGTYGVGSRFFVLRSRTRFRRFRGCRVPF